MFLFTSGRETLVVGCVITRLIKCVHHENINVRCDTIKFSERDLPFQRFTRDVIEKVTHIAHAKQPAVCRCSSPVEDGVGSCFDGPIVPYRRVLILVIRFRMPTTYVVHSEDIFNPVGNFNLSIIADYFTHSSSESDIIFQGIDKLIGAMNTIHIRD